MLKVKKMSKSAMAVSFVAVLVLGSLGVGGVIFAQQFTSSIGEEENVVTTLDVSSEEPIEAEGGYYELISVKLSDETMFPKEDWERILRKIEKGEVILEDE
ncbi:hypothetical protein [Alkalihalobacillus sp. LMS39]|uniref:hypothetical protein n=1 Tax=Alkalihalobacillus sp. LMS39 TaxID=2924032 RepID=UPI001FB272F9|nr:hypothetical protein [Alkalihalobacillus sp. LMS39]UOE92679.1 hypothetical protein MM271_15735 [Alkalihalobacillus sp. LMS39]